MTDSAGDLKPILEALLFAAEAPLSARELAGIVEESTPAAVEAAIGELNAGYLRDGRAFRIESIAGGYRFVTRPEFAAWIVRLRAAAPRPRLTQAALETLAIVAYRQPVTRAELEAIRGVTVEAVLKTLVERDLIGIAGRGEGVGRPLLYRTTDHFLEYFGLPGLEALPKPDELEVLFADREGQAELELDAARRGDDPGAEGEPR